MTLAQLLISLTDAERDFIARLDYESDVEKHRRELDIVIERGGDVDLPARVWHPYEVIELGKNDLRAGHEREYTACLGIVLKNVLSGRDTTNGISDVVEQRAEEIARLPADLRAIIEHLDNDIKRNGEQGSPSNAG